MSTYKQKSTLSLNSKDQCTRLNLNPIISPNHIQPSDPRLGVIGVLNPTFIEVDKNKYLIIRIDEKPSIEIEKENHKSSERGNLNFAYINVNDGSKLDIVTIKEDYHKEPIKRPIIPENVREKFRIEHNINLLLSYISHLRIAKFDGDRWNVSKTPLLFPCCEQDQYGCEDPRITIVDNNMFLLYTAISKYGATTWMAQLSDNMTIISKRILLGPDHKHSVLFPGAIGSTYYLLSRPLSRTYIRASGIWLYTSNDLEYWGKPIPLLFPRAGKWDSQRVGASASPIRIDDGWLLFYYGVDDDDTYRIGTALLDINNPKLVIGRREEPILSPFLEWERNGRRADTVFSCGVEVLRDCNKFHIYYAGADTNIGVAEIDLKNIIRSF